jgi:hypothetical protein
VSVQAISWVLEHSRSEGNARLVLISIANHADKHGRSAFPSQSTIASEAGCSTRTVRRSIEELHDLGELRWLEHGGKGKRRRSHLYWILPIVEAAKVSAIPEELSIPDTIDRRTGQVRQPDADTRGRGTVLRTVHIEPGVNAAKKNNGKSRARELIEQLASKKAIGT